MKKILGLVFVLFLTACVPQAKRIECESTLFGDAQILSVEIEQHTLLLDEKKEMSFDFKTPHIDNFTAEIKVSDGVKLSSDELMKTANENSIKVKTSTDYSLNIGYGIVHFNEAGYKYVTPAIFVEYTTVKIPVYPKVSRACSREPIDTYIKYPTNFVLDGVFSN